MSIALMTLAWKSNLPTNQKMALLAMCDWANDEGGSLHPSIARVAERISCSERQAQRIVHGLIEAGWIAVVGNAHGGAPGQARRYQLNVKRLETGDMGVTGDKLTRVTWVTQTGDMDDVRRVTPVTQTGDMGVTLTTIEPSIEPSVNHHKAIKRPTDVSPQVWSDFVAMRKKRRAELTNTALNGIRSEAQKAGVDLQTALETCCTRGWQSFRSDWIEKQTNGRPLNKLEKLEQSNNAIGNEWLRDQGFSV